MRRNPYIGLHPDLFSEGEPQFKEGGEAHRALGVPPSSAKVSLLSEDAVNRLIAYRRGDTPVFVPLEELSSDQIRALPRRAFTQQEWAALSKSDRAHIEENDEERQERIENFVKEFKRRFEWEQNEEGDFSWVEQELDSRIAHEADELFKHVPSRTWGALRERAEELHIPETDLISITNEVMQDSNNYNITTASSDYNAIASEQLRGSIWMEHDEVEKLVGDMFPDELKEACRRVNRETGLDLAPKDFEPRNNYRGEMKYPEIELSWDLDRYIVAEPDWNRIESEIEEKLNEYELPDNVDIEATPPEERVIHRWPDGFYAQELLPSELADEGKAMGMCVGRPDMGYGKAVRNGEIEIISLRRPSGRPLFTLEVTLDDEGDPVGVDQVKGKANRLPGFNVGQHYLLWEGEHRRTEALRDLKRDEVERAFLLVERVLGIPVSKVKDLDPASLAILEGDLSPGSWGRRMVEEYDIPSRAIKKNPAGGSNPHSDAECEHGPSCTGFCRPYRSRRSPVENPAKYPWLSLATIARYEPLARERGVSDVARSSRGFLTAYKRAGSANELSVSWKKRRADFIRRHTAQAHARGEKMWDRNGRPSRRHLALIMWAYSPVAREL